MWYDSLTPRDSSLRGAAFRREYDDQNHAVLLRTVTPLMEGPVLNDKVAFLNGNSLDFAVFTGIGNISFTFQHHRKINAVSAMHSSAFFAWRHSCARTEVE